MAKYGARYMKWAPFATANAEPENALPNYGEAISLSKLVKVTDSPTYAEGKLYGDDELAEYVSEFVENPIDVECTDMINEMAAAVYGAALDEESGEVSFDADDNPPYGGFGFVSLKMVNGAKSYVGIFYPKCKAQQQGEEYSTKGDSITFTTSKLRLMGSAAKNGVWKQISEGYNTLAEAKAWVDGKFTAAAAA